MRVDSVTTKLLRQSGLSLIELMIALALGVILLLGLIEIFGSVRASFNAAEARARIQESGRFSLEFMRRDVRMAGHLGCQNEYFYFPNSERRIMEPTGLPDPDNNGATDRGFYNHLGQAGVNSIKDNAPYVTRINRPIEVYDFNGTAPGDGTYAIGSATPVPSGNPGDWTPNVPDAGLNNISSRAVPGSDIIVVRYLDENPIAVAPVTGVPPVNLTTGLIQLDAPSAASVQEFALYGMTQCSINALFQVTAKPTATSISAAGGLNIPRPGGLVFDGTGDFSAGSLIYRYRFYAYYVGRNPATGIPGLYRQSLIAEPANAAQGIQFAPAEELVEGVEMMQIMVGADTDTPREDFVNAYRSPDVQVAGGTPAEIDDNLRAITTVRVSLLIRSNTSAANAERAIDTIPVGGVNVTLPADFRARQTYDMTTVIRNRVRT